MVRSPNVDQLILGIHSAVLDPGRWTQVGHELRTALSADSGLMMRISPRASPPWLHSIGFDPVALQAYAGGWSTQDAWYAGAVRNRRIQPGLISVDMQLLTRREYRDSAFFNDFLRHFDVDRMVNVCLAGHGPNGSHGAAAISFYRGMGKEGFSDEDIKLLSVLSPHLVVATQAHWSMQSMGLLADAYREALDAVSAALFLIDQSGRLMRANWAGEQLIRKRLWLQVLNGRLVPHKHLKGASSLEAALRQATTGSSFKLTVTETAAGIQAIVQGAPLSPRTDAPFAAGAAALVWVIPLKSTVNPVADLARLFALSSAERRLLERLLLVDDLRTVASALGISIHTARSQLKSIFNKTGRRTQAQLLALAARMESIRSPSPGAD